MIVGNRVSQLLPGLPAAKDGGIKPGDLIIAVDCVPVDSTTAGSRLKGEGSSVFGFFVQSLAFQAKRTRLRS